MREMNKQRRSVKRQILGVSAVAVVALLAACSTDAGNTDTDTDKPAIQDVSVVIGTGPEGGVYAVAGAGISELVNNHIEGARASTQTTAASLENTRLVRDGEIDLGLGDALALAEAIDQKGAFADDPPTDSIRFIGGWYPALGHHLVLEGSDIKSLGDMAGRSACLPPGVQSTMFDQILSAWGLSIDDVNVTIDEYSNCADRVARGEIDMFNYNGGGNSAIVIQAASLAKMRILPVPSGTEAKLKKNGFTWWFETEMPADMYPELGGTPATIVANATGLLIGNESLSDEFVYELVKTMHEQHADLAKLHPAMEAYAFPTAAANPFDESKLQTHPGALKYFVEQGWR